jgi:hypothetical protein
MTVMDEPQTTHPPTTPVRRRDDGGRSRVTAGIRLLLAVWLMWSAALTLNDPPGAAASRGAPVDIVLPLAGLYFALGIFLLSGFMSRITGLVLAGLAVWEMAQLGVDLPRIATTAIGVYLLLRGGGAWAMDVYVSKLQDRVRERVARERAAAELAARAPSEER